MPSAKKASLCGGEKGKGECSFPKFPFKRKERGGGCMPFFSFTGKGEKKRTRKGEELIPVFLPPFSRCRRRKKKKKKKKT